MIKKKKQSRQAGDRRQKKRSHMTGGRRHTTGDIFIFTFSFLLFSSNIKNVLVQYPPMSRNSVRDSSTSAYVQLVTPHPKGVLAHFVKIQTRGNQLIDKYIYIFYCLF